MKLFFRRIHLYLALAAGLVFLVQCLTGTVLVFEEEITRAIQSERYTVAVPARPVRWSLTQLAGRFQQTHSKASVLGFKVYADPARSVELSYREAGHRSSGPLPGEQRPGPAGPGGRGDEKGRPARGSTAYLNPYTGQMLGLQTEKQLPVFKLAEDLHRRLLAGAAGKALTGLSAIFILFITATGLVLWWPRTRDMLRGRLRIKWGASGKRLTHDLHVVLGFYCAPLLAGLALTGVVMSYRWATDGLFWLAGSRPAGALMVPASAGVGGPRTVAYDAALRTGQATYRTAEYWRVSAPRDSAAAVAVSVPSALPLRAAGQDTLFVDRYTGRTLAEHPYSRQATGTQLRRLAKPLHTGEIGGVWTKALVLVVTLAGTTFPLTGVLLWWRRTRKKSPRPRAERLRTA